MQSTIAPVTLECNNHQVSPLMHTIIVPEPLQYNTIIDCEKKSPYNCFLIFGLCSLLWIIVVLLGISRK
jgi:hypothetical protein